MSAIIDPQKAGWTLILALGPYECWMVEPTNRHDWMRLKVRYKDHVAQRRSWGLAWNVAKGRLSRGPEYDYLMRHHEPFVRQLILRLRAFTTQG
jgi:hypothetical protein